MILKIGEDISTPVAMVIGLTFFVLPGLAIYFYHYFQVKVRENTYLPKSKGKETEAFLNAYVCAAVLMIKLDRRDAAEKKELLHHRIVALGEDSTRLWNTFDKIWEDEIHERRIAKWCLKNLNETERSELVYLLIELAYLDDSLLAREYDFLANMMERMQLPLSDLKAMMASHRQRMNRERGQRQQRDRERRKAWQKTKPTSQTKRKLAFQVLGIPENSDDAAIKKAYRALVKKHHPDRFAGESEVVIKAAEERFIEIQAAYEIVTS